MFLDQIGMGGEWWSWILWIAFMVVFFMFYPRLMISQIMWKLERSVRELETLSSRARKIVKKEISKKPDKVVNDSIDRFFEFFAISPIGLDPYGIVKKMDHIIRNQKDRFDYFVDQVAPKMDAEKKESVKMGLAGGMGLYELMKIVRHYVEIIKKTKNIQIAMILQMQLPFVEKMARAIYKGTETMVKGKPIGDALGPYTATKLFGNKKVGKIEEGIAMVNVKIDGKNCFVIKASGPGGRLGFPGKAVERIANKNKIARIITVDAAAKLEGEKTGSVAEGVGVAMGGPGVERSYIEAVVVKKNIPMDSVIVKMSPEEAIEPMKKSIKDAYPTVRESISRSLKRVKKNEKVIIVGVGNSSGVGDSEKEVKEMEKWVDNRHKKQKNKKKKGRFRRKK
ncbi:MAG: DUF1512 family protein [Candidatus Aenigmarchaeota archaeon]|nr:DUF1512 family protein [Candidatus Aenigmarchaeota archaeon]